MKKSQVLLMLSMFVSTSAFAKIIVSGESLYLQTKGKQVPLIMVNSLIQSKTISKLKIYAGGDVNLISYAKDDEAEKLYSVDSKGFVYSIKPFTSYEVQNIDGQGIVQFRQDPKNKYRIDHKGTFLPVAGL